MQIQAAPNNTVRDAKIAAFSGMEAEISRLVPDLKLDPDATDFYPSMLSRYSYSYHRNPITITGNN